MMLLFPVQAAHCHLFMRVFFFFWPTSSPHPLPLPLLLTQQEIWKLCLSVCVCTWTCVHILPCAFVSRSLNVCPLLCIECKLVLEPPAWLQPVHEGHSSLPDKTFFPPHALSLCASALLTVNHLFPSLPYFPRTQHYLNGHFASCH